MADDQQREWLRQTILESRFYWASPSEFNDPFDCAPFLRMPNRRDMAAAVRRVVQNNGRMVNRQQRKQEERRLRRQRRSVLEQRLQVDIPALINESSVYSLTTLPDNVLMWSHYACSHHGVCLQFRARPLFVEFPVSYPVTYTKERPVVTVGAEESNELFIKTIMTKADYWAYEKEWRLIDYRGKRGPRSFPPSALEGVILGARISSEDEALVRGWIQQRTSPTLLFRARFDEREFRLSIDEITV